MQHSDLVLQTIDGVISMIRTTDDLPSAIDCALEKLSTGLGVDRALMWQVVGDQLTVTNEYSKIVDDQSLIGTSFNARTSVALILNFLTEFADSSSGNGAIVVDDAALETNGWVPLFSLSPKFTSHLLVQLRTDIFSGFVVFQSRESRIWSSDETDAVRRVTEVISVLLRDNFFLKKVKTDVLSLNALVKVLEIFLKRNSSASERVNEAVGIIADLMGYKQWRVYLLASDGLLAQGHDGKLELSDVENCFVQVFQSCRGAFQEPGSSFAVENFGGSQGIIMPLIDAGKNPLGAFGLWDPIDVDRELSPQDKELALFITEQLSKAMALADLEIGPTGSSD